MAKQALHSMYVEGHIRTGMTFDPESSMTKQSFKDECDINNIMARFQKTGVIEHVARSEPTFMDVGDVVELQEALAVAERANQAFMALPSNIRAHFENDSMAFIEALHDESRRTELEELGLLPRGEESEPVADSPQNPGEESPLEGKDQSST